ncbi:zincin, partial [Conidiobolus coronatus NRRL 28638]
MSTYLLAFIVAELDYVEAFTKVGTPIPCRVYAPKGTAHLGKFSLDVCTKTLDLFNTVFGTPYPLPKMDMAAIADFDAGAMENWGLVTYRTNSILFDEATTTQSSKQWIASTVTHELAHQWFGNLVTMEWWSDLWLNEGFATWVGNYAVDKLFPDWHFWDTFVVEDVQSGLSLDCLRSSHPIEVEVQDPAEIDQIFDDISYSKGGSVIRMLSAYLTEDVFLEGIRQYLKKHAYGNASTGDLWAQLSETSGQDVSEFMNLWTKHTGYP